MSFKLFGLFFIFLCLHGSFAVADCSLFFWNKNEFQEAGNGKLELIESISGKNHELHLKNSEGEIIASLVYQREIKNHINISANFVSPSYRQNGFSTKLIFIMLTSFPHVKSVGFSFAGVNEEVVNDYLERGYSI